MARQTTLYRNIRNSPGHDRTRLRMNAHAIDVLVLTRGREHALTRLLDSVAPQLGSDDRCYVLENGCPYNSTRRLVARYPRIAFYQSDVNLGVAGGRNAVAGYGCAPTLLFLDDDAVANPYLLSGVRRKFADDIGLSVISFRIDDPELQRPRSYQVPHRNKRLYDTQFSPAYFLGGGCAIRRDMFERVDGYDERLFYSLEELDLAFRLHRVGAKFLYTPALRILHYAAPEGRSSGRFYYYTVRNRWRVPLKYLPVPFVVTHVVAWCTYLLIRALREDAMLYWWKGLLDGVKGVPAAWHERDPLPLPVLWRLFVQGGRLWW